VPYALRTGHAAEAAQRPALLSHLHTLPSPTRPPPPRDCSTNDAKLFNWYGVQEQQNDSYIGDYGDMLGLLAALPGPPQVYVMAPPPLCPPFPFNMSEVCRS
jgi:hypothetical protein